MGNVWDKLVKITAAAAGAATGALGGWSWLMTALMACMVADYISGMIVAWMGKSTKTEYGGLSSKVGAMGLVRKGLMLMVVLVAAMLDKALGQGNAMFRDAVCWFYIANEGLSLMENLSLAGVPFPEKLKTLLGEKADQDE
ncbi:MAG TPA: phage holin family protein [Candidatus Limiplasma sp.]|nr:phage holin family protein [Candidatus Limiplasma sp.]